ncbi:MAG: PDR/VanB family oxidoreductase [Pigmentiphaga sp.]|nr:PDR/VanB family oxidoreductase [Pigmentiphaga sp.]
MQQARLREVRWEAEGILAFRLEPPDGGGFPAFTAGAHIDVELGAGLTRSYSLLSDPARRDGYEIAVQLEPGSRGGSRAIHERWRPGDMVSISAPRNHFPLVEDAPHSVLIAGGIGITPMLSMIARLEALGRSWELHYAVRTRARGAFLDRLEPYPSAGVTIDDEPETPRLDLERILASAGDAHVYCCGPQGMLDRYRSLGEGLGERLHYEYFAADTEVARDGGYQLRLAKRGVTLDVDAGESMLDALLNAGVDVGFACSEGICGSCRVAVLDGVPDHRDLFLTEPEKQENRSIMVCCSGSRSPVLTLDL